MFPQNCPDRCHVSGVLARAMGTTVMKLNSMQQLIRLLRATLVCAAGLSSTVNLPAQPVYETELEFLATGDFNGDGKPDIAIVDRYTGRVRFGYQLAQGYFNWIPWRAGGMDGVTGVSVGRLVDDKHDSLALTAADANLTTIVDAANPKIETDPVKIPSPTLGPAMVTAVDIGGAGNTPLLDLYVASMYPPMRLTLFRNDGKAFKPIADIPAAGEEKHGNRLALKSGGPEFVVSISAGEKGNALLAENLASGKPEAVLNIGDLPANADYVLGNFRPGQAALKQFVFYKAGEPTLTVRAVVESGGKFSAGAAKSFTLDRPLRQLTIVDSAKKSRLLAVFGDREPAELMDFDGEHAPVTAQKLVGATNRFLTAALALPDAVVLFSVTTNDHPRSVSHYQVHTLQGEQYAPGAFGALETLDPRDDSTVSNIHARIVATLTEKTAADMKPYTNMIPGTDVPYAMVPIPPGEFLMGSPEPEPGHRPDESPQHRVKISPLWMGRFEVTWEQYLLFMYPEDEKELRKSHPTDVVVDDVVDAVTRPSHPYVPMDFGMGTKSKRGGIGFPAIAMTQHAANKFCHWLSAKTGHFYRLPTEAEWEYACRAGTTNAYSFGDDPKKLPDYAWFFENSDSKYQECGKKLPNPWGLYDMHGNLVEWVLDQYDSNYYAACAAKGVVTDPWNKATQPYPHSVRGGSWDDDSSELRSAARRGSDRTWKMTDPQLPKGKWYLTDAKTVGFRIVRPLAVPSAEDLAKYWISGVERE